ncbi:DUF2062 domain-containing protein [Marivibrio halodurans]|uniref:DUF2062 domain-containing protein n=1 Tax=Marivibrio halodurans TaxID=2039722 RepID=A0A8J7S054_9PROT|nr:DUF2062 domain-containing protein [Marivibrio halodurans]MBP5857855.1 DUF2062 domain-containing protein [Marivibrio halodurans]
MARPEEKKATFGGVSRLMRYRLMIPIHRNRQDPRPAARGVAIGLFFALMPTVGVQLALLGLFWAAMRWLRPQWRFNLIVAAAWIWVTNILTIPFVYYVFLVTGRLMLGEPDPFGGFEHFVAHMHGLLSSDASFFESLFVYTIGIFEAWGLPLFVGCIPWAIGGAWLGYVWCLKLLRRLHARQRRKMEARFAAEIERRKAQGASGGDASSGEAGATVSSSSPRSSSAG